MKIYIHTDLEGISGITKPEQVALGNDVQPEYSVSRLMADTNAAVDGAFTGGATHVTVLDAHRGGRNFDLNMLDPRAEADPRANGKWWGKLDESYDGTMYVGAHAMMGTPCAFLCHSNNLQWHNYMINGRRMGELGMWAVIAGHYGVPMLMVSGDLAACQEAKSFFDPVATAAVKQAVCMDRADALPDGDAEDLIRRAAAESIALIKTARPFKPIMPMEIKIEYAMGWADNPAERTMRKPGVERLDGRTVRRVTDSALDIFI